MPETAATAEKQAGNKESALALKLAITKDRLKTWSACTDGYRWFLEHYPQGGQFAEIYAALNADKRYDDLGWLLERVFAELDTADLVQQTVLISGCNTEAIEKLAKDGGADAAATTGEGANAATTGEGANAATTGEGANAATTGDWANAATTGDWANAATTGEGANAATTGYRANAATTGEGANAATTGDWANAATTGDWANAATTGEGANAATTGEGANAATTGDWANAATTGAHAVAAALGIASRSKAAIGGAIVLVHRTEEGELKHIFSSKVGDNGIKADVWYVLDSEGVPIEVLE